MKSVTAPYCWNEKLLTMELCWQCYFKISGLGGWSSVPQWPLPCSEWEKQREKRTFAHFPPLISWLHSWQKLQRDMDVTWSLGWWCVTHWILDKRVPEAHDVIWSGHSIPDSKSGWGLKVTCVVLLFFPTSVLTWYTRWNVSYSH